VTASSDIGHIRFGPRQPGGDFGRDAVLFENRSGLSDQIESLANALFRPDSSPPGYHPLVDVESPPSIPASAAELISRQWALDNRVQAGRLLTNLGLGDAQSELGEIEEHLLSGGRRRFKHAAYSARELLKEVADHLFPARNDLYKDRFGTERKVGPRHVGNRLLAFVDQERTLSTSEQEDLGVAMRVLNEWAGGGPHVAWSPERSHRTYVRLLDVLAAVAVAHDASVDRPAGEAD
jgi:hypothetical protein